MMQVLKGEPLTVFGDGSQTRSFCYISDMLRGLTELMNSHVHEPVNLGNPEELSINEVAEIMKKRFNPSCAIVFKSLPVDDPKVRRPDIKKAIEILSWKPEVSFSNGLEMTHKYFEKLLKEI